MTNAVFWDVMPCGSFKNRCFGRKYCSIMRVKRISELDTTLAVTSTLNHCEETLTIINKEEIGWDTIEIDWWWKGGGGVF
jgi:hypothetical protein